MLNSFIILIFILIIGSIILPLVISIIYGKSKISTGSDLEYEYFREKTKEEINHDIKIIYLSYGLSIIFLIISIILTNLVINVN